MNQPEQRLQIKKFILASREKVFAAWTRTEHLQMWFAPGAMTVPFASVDLRVGGKYRIQMKNPDTGKTSTAFGTYTEIVPDRKLVFTWSWEHEESLDSVVTVEFLDKDQGTEVSLTHKRLVTPERVKSHAQGWNGCLDNLAARIGKM